MSKPVTLSIDLFHGDWDLLYSFLERRGFPKWIYIGDLDWETFGMDDFYNLVEVHGDLDFARTTFKSLDTIKRVTGYVDLNFSDIEDLGDLEYVGSDLFLIFTPFSKKTEDESEVRDRIELMGDLTW